MPLVRCVDEYCARDHTRDGFGGRFHNEERTDDEIMATKKVALNGNAQAITIRPLRSGFNVTVEAGSNTYAFGDLDDALDFVFEYYDSKAEEYAATQKTKRA